ncbi:MAG: 50S ribosomal protein L22 [Candidatus Woesearchaeota archaeon]
MVGYSFSSYKKETMARACGVSLPISTKQAVEICRRIRNLQLGKAKTILRNVIEMKEAVPFKRYKHNIGHRTGMGPGRYPVKACREILKIISSCEANAQMKGLSIENLVIKHISANKATRPWHYGRQRRRRMKRTHIQIVVEESAVKSEQRKKERSKNRKPLSTG